MNPPVTFEQVFEQVHASYTIWHAAAMDVAELVAKVHALRESLP